MSGIVKKPNQTSPESYSPRKPEILNLFKQKFTSNNFTENVIQGISDISYGNPSAVCYIGSVMRLMDYLNDPIEQDELFAFSGTALCFPWKYSSCCDEVSIIPEIPKRTFDALGYESEYFYEPDITMNPRAYSKEFYIQKIKDSIDNHHPVIGFGLTEQNFTCLITGYYNHGNGLYLRAYWSPKGIPEGYDNDKNYYSTEDWYDKCYGIVIIGDKTNSRLAGRKAYDHIVETAKIFKEKRSVPAQGQTIPVGFSAFDAMTDWLLNDDSWKELKYREQSLKQCGILLLNHYRSFLHSYLKKLSKEYPDVVKDEIFTAIEKLGENVGGQDSDLHLNEKVSAEITDFSKMNEHSVREKVAEYVQRLKEYDVKIFDCLL